MAFSVALALPAARAGPAASSAVVQTDVAQRTVRSRAERRHVPTTSKVAFSASGVFGATFRAEKRTAPAWSPAVVVAEAEEPARTPANEEGEETEFRKKLVGREREQFIRIPTDNYECRSCAYTYEVDKGDVFRRIEPGTAWDDIAADYKCPVCSAPKSAFVRKYQEIAGFAENQGYGLGGNSLSSGQKQALIYGGLLFFILFFLFGYAIN
eukprot:tig00020912_g15797.t1